MVEQHVEQWGVFEAAVSGPDTGNPFVDVTLTAVFRLGHRSCAVEGFYDGDGRYLVRFMPDRCGEWSYEISGLDLPDDERTGSFTCVPPAPGNHGPVRVSGPAFRHEDGTRYTPFGTTCYVWSYQPEDVRQRTLRTLAGSPFNKIRMCVFPKNYAFNEREPERTPFPRDGAGFDLTRFDPVFFRDLEAQVLALRDLGVECDLILFHPYDRGRWGFDRMPEEVDHAYLRYVIARLGCFRNIWWSLANEYDFMREKCADEWDRLFHTVEQHDPYQHLRSIHNGTRMYDPDSLRLYDHHKPWVSHVSLQHWDLHLTRGWRATWGKPVVVDECGYEGDLHQRWGNLTAQAVVERVWTGTLLGGYVGHGETYRNASGEIWWSHGGDLVGGSPARIAFLRTVLDRLPPGAAPLEAFYDAPTTGVEGQAYLQYFGQHSPGVRQLDLPAGVDFHVDVIDTWEMTTQRLDGTVSGAVSLELPGRPYVAVLLTAATPPA
ncbi:DUF5605 domain-containing protein [Desertihabitans aurantiacus]|uniref:DUF5605 domain-containing protein n=1 Tax=Desertihabitans aurantiacus TaxID=2282477 RepID=UPI000DF78065|nr:DUF5060 domain-containing protein [Desertihabitans aurantiacus]